MRFSKLNFLAFCLVVLVASTGLVFSSEPDRELAESLARLEAVPHATDGVNVTSSEVVELQARELQRQRLEDERAVNLHKEARRKEIEEENRFRLDDSAIDHGQLAKEVRREFETHADVLNKSRNQDIIAFLGKTGAGKSTLINFIANKVMKSVGRDLVLQDSSDAEAMVIGCGGNSQTIYPKFIQVENLLLYDFPGFGDTAGTVRNLVNASFIRRMLVEAKSVRLVIVASESEFEAGRGALVREMLDSMKRLFGAANVLQNHSVLAITKCSYVDPQSEVRFILERTQEAYHGMLNVWFNGRYFLLRHVSTVPTEHWSDDKVRSAIRDVIRIIPPTTITDIDVSVIYPANTTTALERMFFSLMQEKFNTLGILSKLSKLDLALEDLSIDQQFNGFGSPSRAVVVPRETFWKRIDREVSSVEHVRLLKEFCETPYETALTRFKTTISQKLGSRRAEIVRELRTICAKKIEDSKERYYRDNGDTTPRARCFTAFSEEFQGNIYGAILEEIDDIKEKEEITKKWKEWTVECRQKMLSEYGRLYDLGVAEAIRQ